MSQVHTYELIFVANPRAATGKDITTAWARLLPSLWQDDEGKPDKKLSGEQTDKILSYKYYLPAKGGFLSRCYKSDDGKRRNLRPQRWERKGPRRIVNLDNTQQKRLISILTKEIGLSSTVSGIFSRLPLVHIKRILDFISGLVDSLWLAEERVFLLNSPDSMTIRYIIRKVMKVGISNLPLLVTWWKDWGSNLIRVTSQSILLKKGIELQKNNFFRALDKLSFIRELYNVRDGNFSKRQLCSISHITSSRQMPFMGDKTNEKSEDDFVKVITSNFTPSPEHFTLMTNVARRIGRMCRNIHPAKFDYSAHISVNSSGSFYKSIKDGGQSSEVYGAVLRILTTVPTESSTEQTPFGPASIVEGVPLWKTIYRSPESMEEVMPKEFLSPRPLIKEQEGRFWGLDDVLGKQIMYCAWKDSLAEVSAKKIPIRAIPVPETGNKARFVTMSPYWVNILFAPLSHLLTEALKCHPTVWGSFHRMDQTWETARRLLKVKLIEDSHYCLSSDLKDATNAQSMDLSRVMIKAFLQGANLPTTESSAYINYVISLICPREVEFPLSKTRRKEKFTSTRGIFMGEAIAKPALTLLNVCIEELAFIKYVAFKSKDTLRIRGKTRKQSVISSYLESNQPTPFKSWRMCYIAGDDHLCVGPRTYLDMMTSLHIASGSIISVDKHSISRIFVKFTEKILDIKYLFSNQGNREKLSAETIIVDSVKVRLLSQGQSTLIKKDQKNVAIGKAMMLAKTLSWLPPEIYFPGKIDTIRELFIIRMGPLFPSKHINPKSYNHIHLPAILGGLNLARNHELINFIRGSPYPLRLFISKVIRLYKENSLVKDVGVRKLLNELRSLNSNCGVRGVSKILQYKSDVIDHLNTYSNMFETCDVKDYYGENGIEQSYPSDSPRKTLELAEADGWYSAERFAETISRGTLFQELLMSTVRRTNFSTKPFVQTFAKKCWQQLLTFCSGESELDWNAIDHKMIKKAFSPLTWTKFFNSKLITTFDYGSYEPGKEDEETWDFRDGPLMDSFMEGFPTLILGSKFLYGTHQIEQETNLL